MSGNENPRIPAATYRLQLHPGFTFRDARAILDYLKDLGISDVYVSPYFQASPASTHGYDVSDHNRLNPALGSEEDFRDFVSGVKERGMGQVLDFVPNHMGIGERLNRWWAEVLEDGIASPYAQFFDIDWHPGKEALTQKVLLPILGDRYGKVLENGELKLAFESGGFFLYYYDTTLPISPASYPAILLSALAHLGGDLAESLSSISAEFEALYRVSDASERLAAKARVKAQLQELADRKPGVASAIDRALRVLEGEAGNAVSFDSLHALLERQAYRLSYWRVAAEEINYRRFFDITTLAAIRVEIPEVFDAAHQFVFELLTRGDVTGLRIDHVDGLWNPRVYLCRLQERYAKLRSISAPERPLYLLVEKILDFAHERLPADWPVHGTTGYEFANQVAQLFVNRAAETRMTKIYRKFAGVIDKYSDLIQQKKRLTMRISLLSEIVALGRMLDQLSEMHRHYRDCTQSALTSAIAEVVAYFPVYRTYAAEDGSLSPEDEKVILRAVLAARRGNPSIQKPALDFLRSVLLLRLPEGLTAEQRSEHIRFVMKFQQCTGPVMAKGVEDTTFYIYNRLVALNEVGGDPSIFGIDAVEFHRLNCERFERSPHTMLATSTHDTKRSEDVRMRLAVLSEVPDLWQQALRRWAKFNKKHRVKVGDDRSPSRNEEYLLYQTLLGTWPLEPLDDDGRRIYRERIQQYMVKAIKEAKVNSSWIEPNDDWETAVTGFVQKILDGNLSGAFLSDFASFADEIARFGALNSLAQTVLKCTSPGVPDIYQGNEIWDFSLVDPDNRRPVDFGARRLLLESLSGANPAELMQNWRSGAIKLFVLQRLLAFRRTHAQFFREADYFGLEAAGPRAQHVVAFVRRHKTESLLVVVPRLVRTAEGSSFGSTWQSTDLIFDNVDPRPWRNLLAEEKIWISDGEWPLAVLLADLPIAVLFQSA